MLYIYAWKLRDDCIYQIKKVFQRYKKPEWFQDPFVQKVIREIDLSEVVNGDCIDSPVFGKTSPDSLANGTKALILMRMLKGYNIYGTSCGDNCSPYIVELSQMQDVTITLRHYMEFKDDFEAIMMDSGRVVHHVYDYLEEMLFLHGDLRERISPIEREWINVEDLR